MKKELDGKKISHTSTDQLTQLLKVHFMDGTFSILTNEEAWEAGFKKGLTKEDEEALDAIDATDEEKAEIAKGIENFNNLSPEEQEKFTAEAKVEEARLEAEDKAKKTKKTATKKTAAKKAGKKN